MKKNLLPNCKAIFEHLISLVSILLAAVTVHAQGEWKWAHYWSGNDESASIYYNQIINTAFDDDGNIYVYGSMGGHAAFDGELFHYDNHPQVLSDNERTILLTKFDTLGNMLWYKVVKSSAEMAFPLWMEVRNNKITIAGNCGFYGSNPNDWLYYLDTLVFRNQINNIPLEQQELPFKAYSRWTFFAQMDLDGNLLEDHFVVAYSREKIINGTDSIRRNMNLCMNDISPVHIGDDGSVYVYTPIQYTGNENQPYTIVIDEDSNKTYNQYFPGSANVPWYINNFILYKFSSNWELEFAKPLVAETEGIAPYSGQQPGDYVKYQFEPHLEGLSFDDDDNMYLTGFIRLFQSLPGLGGLLNQYPVHIWWDSLHVQTMHDFSSAIRLNFIVKYNTSGDVQWCNQLSSRCGNNQNLHPAARWGRSCVMGNSVFVLGDGGYTVSNNSLLYFDDEDTPLQYYQEDSDHIGFFVRYNKDDGRYINQGIVPMVTSGTDRKPFCINNRVFGVGPYKLSGQGRILIQWGIDGSFIRADTLIGDKMEDGMPIVNENGYLLTSLTAIGPVQFGNDVLVDCPSSQSSAVFALYHNPEFAQPFVPDDSVGIEEYLGKRESDIYIYPNPTSGEAVVCGYMYGYTGIELFDLQGRKIADLVESHNGTFFPAFDLSPYPAGTYIVKINFERGVNVTRKVVKR